MVTGQTSTLEVAKGVGLSGDGPMPRQYPLWVKNRHRTASVQCPLYPQKRTLVELVVMSALCQKQTLCSAAIHGDFRTHPVGR